MIYAEVKYTGPMQSSTTRGLSGKKYSFSNPMGGSPIPVGVESIRDARKFEQKDSYEVEWTPKGKLAKRVSGPIEDVSEMVADIDYHDKLGLVSEFGLDPESREEEELNAELEKAVEDLQRQMEN